MISAGSDLTFDQFLDAGTVLLTYPVAARLEPSRLPRCSGGASCGSPSSVFGRFNRFKMVLSGSSGSIDQPVAVDCSTTFDLALATQLGCVRAPAGEEQEGHTR